MQYIDMAAADATSPSVKGDTSLSGGKRARQQQDGNASTSSSLHVTIGSEVGDLSESAAASMLTGEREGANENGGKDMLESPPFSLSLSPLPSSLSPLSLLIYHKYTFHLAS